MSLIRSQLAIYNEAKAGHSCVVSFARPIEFGSAPGPLSSVDTDDLRMRHEDVRTSPQGRAVLDRSDATEIRKCWIRELTG